MIFAKIGNELYDKLSLHVLQWKFMNINICNIYAPSDWEIVPIQRNN